MAALASPGAAEEDIGDASEVVKSKPISVLLARRESRETEGGRAGLQQQQQEPSGSPNGGVPGALESVSLSDPPRQSNSDSDGSGSQTVLLRSSSSGAAAGRPASSSGGLESLRLSSRIDFTQTDTFRAGGKTCTVTLEEDRITWAPKKAAGTTKQTHNTHTHTDTHTQTYRHRRFMVICVAVSAIVVPPSTACCCHLAPLVVQMPSLVGDR